MAHCDGRLSCQYTNGPAQTRTSARMFRVLGKAITGGSGILETTTTPYISTGPRLLQGTFQVRRRGSIHDPVPHYAQATSVFHDGPKPKVVDSSKISSPVAILVSDLCLERQCLAELEWVLAEAQKSCPLQLKRSCSNLEREGRSSCQFLMTCMHAVRMFKTTRIQQLYVCIR